MKKILVIVLTLLLLAACCFPLASCGISERTLKNIVSPPKYKQMIGLAQDRQDIELQTYYATIKKLAKYTILVSSNSPDATIYPCDTDVAEIYRAMLPALNLSDRDYSLKNGTYYFNEGRYFFALLKNNVCYGYAIYDFTYAPIHVWIPNDETLITYVEGKVFDVPVSYDEVKAMFAEYK